MCSLINGILPDFTWSVFFSAETIISNTKKKEKDEEEEDN